MLQPLAGSLGGSIRRSLKIYSRRYLLVARRQMSSGTRHQHSPALTDKATALLSHHHDQYDIEYKHFFSNHLPHAIIALYHLNASPDRLQSFADKYAETLEPAHHETIPPPDAANKKKSPYNDDAAADASDAVDQITDANWQTHIGKKKFFAQYYDFFRQKIGRQNAPTDKARDDVVEQFFPVLSHGALHSALHPLIHLGWSLSLPASIAVNTTAEGLAYCAFAHFEYDRQVSADKASTNYQSKQSLTPFQTMYQSYKVLYPHLAEIERGIELIPYRDMQIGAFQRRMIFISHHYANIIHDYTQQLHIPPQRSAMMTMVNDLLDFALLLYAASDNDFFILHICTALLGVIHIAPRLHTDKDLIDTIQLFTYGWIMVWFAQKYNGVQHQYITRLSQCHTAEEERLTMDHINDEMNDTMNELSWSSILDKAIECDDEHTIKLCYVCWHCNEHDGRLRSLYKFVANKRLQYILHEDDDH